MVLYGSDKQVIEDPKTGSGNMTVGQVRAKRTVRHIEGTYSSFTIAFVGPKF